MDLNEKGGNIAPFSMEGSANMSELSREDWNELLHDKVKIQEYIEKKEVEITKQVMNTTFNQDGVKIENGTLTIQDKYIDENNELFQGRVKCDECSVLESVFDNVKIFMQIVAKNSSPDFVNCVFKKCDFSVNSMENSIYSNNVTEYCIFKRVRFEGCLFIDCTFEQTVFEKCAFERTLFDERCMFNNVNFENSNFSLVNIHSLTEKLKKCKVKNTIFEAIYQKQLFLNPTEKENAVSANKELEIKELQNKINLLEEEVQIQKAKKISNDLQNAFIRKEQQETQAKIEYLKELWKENHNPLTNILVTYCNLLDDYIVDVKYKPITVEELENELCKANEHNEVVIKYRDMSDIDFTQFGKKLAFIHFIDCLFIRAVFKNMIFNHVRFNQCDLDKANMIGIQAFNTYWEGCIHTKNTLIDEVLREYIQDKDEIEYINDDDRREIAQEQLDGETYLEYESNKN